MKKNYTLIEMLVVLVVASILMAVSVPTFVKLVAGHGVMIDTRNISGKLTQCRAYAINRRLHIALLIPDNLPEGRQAYRACFIDIDKNNEFLRYVQAEKWEDLSKGVVIVDTLNLETIREVEYDGQEMDMKGIIFAPTGRIFFQKDELGHNKWGHSKIVIAEGFSLGGTVRIKNADDSQIISGNGYTGRITIASGADL